MRTALLLIASLLVSPAAFCQELTPVYSGYISPTCREPVTFLGSTGVNEFLRRVQGGNVWTWQKPQHYHRSAVVVRCPSGAGGSGTVVAVNGNKCIVLTCEHVIEGNREVTITFQGGQRARGQVVMSWREYDVAGVYVPNPPAGFVGVPVSAVEPPRDATLEVMGFGGPQFGEFRPYVAARHPARMSPIALDAPSISGDSGSGIIWQSHIVGVQFGAFTEVNPPPRYSGVPLIYPASSKATAETLQQFMTQMCDRIGGCSPIFGNPSRPIGNPQEGNPFYPQDDYDNLPQQPIQQQPVAPPQQVFPPPAMPQAPMQPYVQPQPYGQPYCPCVPRGPGGCPCADGRPVCPCPNCTPPGDDEVDVEKLKELIVEELLKDPRFKGPKGDSASVTDEDLAIVAAAVFEKMLQEPVFRGPQGLPGKDGKDGVNGKDGAPGRDGLPGKDGKDASVSQEQIEAIKADILANLPKIRVMMIDDTDKENPKVLDDETFEPGKPIMLNFQRIIKNARATQ